MLAVVDTGPLYAAVDADDTDHDCCVSALQTPGRRLVGAKASSGCTQPLDLTGQIRYLEVHAVPAARHLAAAIRQKAGEASCSSVKPSGVV